jgi:hypothetical protein
MSRTAHGPRPMAHRRVLTCGTDVSSSCASSFSPSALTPPASGTLAPTANGGAAPSPRGRDRYCQVITAPDLSVVILTPRIIGTFWFARFPAGVVAGVVPAPPAFRNRCAGGFIR